MRSIAAPVLIVLAIVGLLSVPAVRASAQSFLALFRVVNFVAVPVDENRMVKLAAENLDPPHLIGEQMQVLEDPGPPTAVASPEQAGAVAGFAVRTPAYVPTAVYPSGIAVKGQLHFQVTPDTERLRQVMDTLSINDLEIPQGLDGEIVDVRVPPVVMVRYDRGGALAVQLLQAKSPAVSLPNGLDLRALGEIGLRVLGLPPVEAREFAAAIDWQTTHDCAAAGECQLVQAGQHQRPSRCVDRTLEPIAERELQVLDDPALVRRRDGVWARRAWPVVRR